MKSTVTITLDSDVIKEARKLKIKISKLFNDTLIKEVAKLKEIVR